MKGASQPPSKKRALSKEEKEERAKTYEREKQSRGWLDSWRVGDNGDKRDWLINYFV